MIGLPGIRRHARLRELLSAYIDGEVSASETLRVEEHLARCQECRDELASLRSTVGLLRRLPELAVPRSFALSEAPQRRPTPTIVWTARLATSAAAVLLVALLLGDIVGLVGQQRTLEDAVSRAEVQAPGAPAPMAAAAQRPEAAVRDIPKATAPELESAPAPAAPAPAAPAPAQAFAALPAPTPTAAAAPSLAAPAPAPAAPAPARVSAPAPAPPEPAQAFAPLAAATPTADAAPSLAAPAPAPAIAGAAAPSDASIAPTQTPAEEPEIAAQELPTLTAEPDTARALPAPAATPSVKEAPAEVATPTSGAATSADEGREGVAEDDGFSLPLWQVETALGGLFVIFALATFWIARRSRWPL